jgi:peptidoglycan LD-endopeptidase LytH
VKRTRYLLHDDRPPRRWGWVVHLLWIVPLIAVDIWVFSRLGSRPGGCAVVEEPAPAPVAVAAPKVPPWKDLVFPTDQARLLDTGAAGVFQPTASGNPESALYGSVRTAKNGNGLMPSFHEGVDIAAVARDRAGRPTDKVRAVAAGRVGYINRVGGNSNYGKYVVLLHDDPLGDVYTLYAHLAEVESALKPGQAVKPGDVLGTMGHTSSSPIPLERAHVHFEIGLINNMHFAEWYKAKKLKPYHGNFHGRNFLGTNPLDFFAHQRLEPGLDFASHLATVPTAFEIALSTPHKPDFFRRYAALWEGADFDGTPIVVACSENGLPLKGRLATGPERLALGKKKSVVLRANSDVLGRNGSRIVSKSNGGWGLGKNGQAWVEVLTY